MNSVDDRPLVGISSCLLGSEVRYDGGHKHNRYVTDTLGRHIDFVSFCPEVAVGLGTPRTPIRLIDRDGEVRVVNVKDQSLDHTDALTDYATRVIPDVGRLAGYIVKKGSPSCGMERVKVYRNDMPLRSDRGIYTGTLMAALPDLPFEEEGRLGDPDLRNNFITRVFTYHRWQKLADVPTAAALVDFHSRHKLLLLAHHEPTYRELGRLVADAGRVDLDELYKTYIGKLMAGLRHLATPGKHTNVLMHILGYVKNQLTADDKQELLEIIERYRESIVPLAVPLTLLNHYLRLYPNEYIGQQVYLEPAPGELRLQS